MVRKCKALKVFCVNNTRCTHNTALYQAFGLLFIFQTVTVNVTRVMTSSSVDTHSSPTLKKTTTTTLERSPTSATHLTNKGSRNFTRWMRRPVVPTTALSWRGIYIFKWLWKSLKSCQRLTRKIDTIIHHSVLVWTSDTNLIDISHIEESSLQESTEHTEINATEKQEHYCMFIQHPAAICCTEKCNVVLRICTWAAARYNSRIPESVNKLCCTYKSIQQ